MIPSKTILGLFSLLFLISFKESDTDYFEGEIIYDVEYISKNENFTNEKIKQIAGSKIIQIFKKGNYIKKSYTPDNELIRTIYLDLNKGKYFVEAKLEDIIYWVDITKNDSKSTFKILNDSIIGDYKCKIIESETVVNLNNSEKSIIKSKNAYAYDLAVNPKWYFNYKEGNFNEIIVHAKSISVELISDELYWVKIIKVKKVNNRKISPNELKYSFPKNKILKEL